MSKGIRQAALATFIELAPQRVNGSLGSIEHTVSPGNVAFRKMVCNKIEAQFNTSHKSACSAYNWAKVECTKLHPELVVSLGRAEDKKGGRKPKAKADPVTENAAPVVEAPAVEVQAAPVVAAKAPAKSKAKAKKATA